MADRCSDGVERDVFVMAGLSLCGRREDRVGQPIAFLQSCRKLDPADFSVTAVVLPTRPRDIAAGDAFDIDHPGAMNQHRTAFELIAIRMEFARVVGRIGGDEMIRDYVAQQVQPEDGELCEHSALIGNRRGQDVVEGGETVCRNDDKVVASGVDIADFAAGDSLDSGEIGFKDGSQYIVVSRRCVLFLATKLSGYQMSWLPFAGRMEFTLVQQVERVVAVVDEVDASSVGPDR